MLPDDRCGGRRSDDSDQRPGRVACFAAGVDAGENMVHPLELAQQRGRRNRAGEMHQLVICWKPTSVWPLSRLGADEHAGRGCLRLR